MGDESSAVGPGRRQKEPKTGQQDGQRECLDSEQEEGKLQREGGVLQSSRGPLSPGLQGTGDTAKRFWLAVHSTDLPWGVPSLNLTVLPGKRVRVVSLAAVLTCLPRSAYPGPDSCLCPHP